ncbi:MAG: hypothetical protein HGB04_03925 [Chlorobiaceae bacterium]|nr:hypothetical protein [Chlorobiaceae bacterium]
MSEPKIRLLIEMLIDEKFSEQRAIDAVKHVIKQHTAWGKEPPIGAFIQYDRRIKILTYAEITKQSNEGSLSWDDYCAVDVGLDKPRWALIEDVTRYGLKAWKATT